MTKASQRAFAGLLAGLLFAVAAPALAEQSEEALRWLERMTEAVKSLNYKGTFVYNHEGKLETMRLIHRMDANGEQERLYSLTGAPREIIRDNEKVTCYLSDNGSVRVDWRQSRNPFAELLPSEIAPLSAHYRFELQGEGRVAERVAQIVAILPQDQYRYGYRLWIDSENGLLLRSDLLNERGEILEQLLFTRLEVFESIPDEWLQASLAGGSVISFERPNRHRSASSRRQGGEPGWRATTLPPGFDLRWYQLRELPGSEELVEHLLFSDGLASVSVYIEPAHAERAFAGGSRVGAVNAFGRWEQGIQLTVVGEVPAGTVMRIGQALQPVEHR